MLSLIAAVARNRVIGTRGELPWRLPEELAHFKRTTLGKPVIMGRRTFESIGRPLPKRENLVLSRDPGFSPEGVVVAHSLERAIALTANAPEALVIGGAALYAAALPLARTFYLTEVHADVAGETLFPSFDRTQWRETWRRDFSADEQHEYAFSLLTLERRE